MRWTVFCRVVDNFGDIGFAWRLAADLGSRGEDVHLAIDDARALAWLAPHGAPGVAVVDASIGSGAPADVWVETFGCGLPADGAPAKLRVCVNIEHLSAESYVERSHGRPSPRFGPDGEPQPVWFFFPGFNERTGGLLREPDLAARRGRFDRPAWLRAQGVEVQPGERCVSLFCYDNPALAAVLDALAVAPTLLLLTPGFAAEAVAGLLGTGLRSGLLRAVRLPWLAQPDFDHLLWSCDLNFVRGEDSLVRAIWAAAPFVWQLYPQRDAAHAAKLGAFLDWWLADAPSALAGLRDVFDVWNGFAEPQELRSALASVDPSAWTEHCRRVERRCAALDDLTSTLIEFVASKR